jgi:hypothetical protein
MPNLNNKSSETFFAVVPFDADSPIGYQPSTVDHAKHHETREQAKKYKLVLQQQHPDVELMLVRCVIDSCYEEVAQ